MNKLAQEWKPEQLDNTCTAMKFEDLKSKIDLMLKGKLKGRTVLTLVE